MYLRLTRARQARNETSKLRIGFKGKNQRPLLMVWREYWHRGDVVYAEVLLSID